MDDAHQSSCSGVSSCARPRESIVQLVAVGAVIGSAYCDAGSCTGSLRSLQPMLVYIGAGGTWLDAVSGSKRTQCIASRAISPLGETICVLATDGLFRPLEVDYRCNPTTA